ncbi:hypothetical protein PsYK624_131380 [Phanerochaete sordida]|uniref:Nephrocystin 3-like N-terminal domain-containing protein n=1 Tax=Phanerochaete sordida TaxID=48140 RepID=A0A9P3GP11_9APHY|nr:hypothetical protein PsYK624_131380 [Phanerochaete sordida]
MPSNTRRDRIIDSALEVADPALDVLDTVLDIVSVPGLGLIPKALSGVVAQVKLARGNKDVREAFVAKVHVLASAIAGSHEAANHAIEGHGGDQNAIRRAIEHSAEYIEARTILSSSFAKLKDDAATLDTTRGFRASLKRIIHASRDDSTLKGMQDELAGAIERFKLRSHNAIDKGLVEIQRLLQESEERRIAAQHKREQDEKQRRAVEQRQWKEAEDAKVILQLPRADAGYRAVDYLKSGFMDGTRKELFGQIRSWAAGQFPPDSPKRFYALFGRAGMGKSAVAHRLCRHVNDGDFVSGDDGTLVLGASFFFVRDSGDKASALLLPPTVAWQLSGCTSLPVFRTLVADAARSYIAHGTQQQLEYAFRGLLEPLSAATASLASNQRVFLVIDGLDECSDQRLMDEALTHLFTLIRTLPWLYIFTASRPERHIMDAFSSSVATAVVHIQDLGETSDSREDVEIYLLNTVLVTSPYSTLLVDERNLLQRLLDRAGGLFIFARIASDFLRVHRNMAEHALELILLPAEGGPSSSMDLLYLQILHFAFPPESMHLFPHQHAHLIAFLHILLLGQHTQILKPRCLALLGHQLCQTPLIRHRLSPKTAHRQIGLSKENINSIISSLRSVLSINEDSKVVPLHATLGEFLLDPTRCTDPLYQVNEGEGHAGLASACLGVVSSLRAVTDLLACLHDRDQDMSDYGDYALKSLDEHLDNASWTESLDKDLTQFVSSIQLPLMARLIASGRVRSSYVSWQYQGLQKFSQKNNGGISIRSSSKETPAVSVAEEYLKFMAYCLCLIDHVGWQPDEDWPEISEVAGGWYADQIEVGRYRSVVLALKAEIDQDERARGLWYDFSVEW